MDIKKLTKIALLCAISVVSMMFIKIPLIPSANFLTYDPSSVFIVAGALIFGPVTGIIMSVIVGFIQMFVTSGASTGLWGVLMYIIATISFMLPPAILYKRGTTPIKSIVWLIIGLVIGVIVTIAVMIGLNILITPLYTGAPREVVMGMIIPIILPFNSIKLLLNSGLILFFLLGKTITKLIKKK